MKQYAVREKNTEKVKKPLSEFHPLLIDLLLARGVTTREQAEIFLKPDYARDVHDPFLLKDMKKAVERILKAIDEKEKIIIYSDYDHDGVPGAVILHDFFKKIGYQNFENYIPHRHEEGFGFHKEAVEEFAKKDVKLVITIDCGIADVVATARAEELGINVIITDHHLVPTSAPSAFAIVNPKQSDCEYPEKMLCGAGVIFKVVQALALSLKIENLKFKIPTTISSVTSGWEKWLLDMAGIATLSDMVPLVGENRALAYYGLTVLRKSPRVGLQALLKVTKIDQRYISEDDIGFMIAPRINAASRMGIPYDAFRLFATTDPVEAGTLATHLDTINTERKGVVAGMVKEIKKQVSHRYGDEVSPKLIVMGNPDWKPALLGLIASNIVDTFSCPVFLWGREAEANGILKGSCRSYGSMHMLDLMHTTPPGTFLQFGGHAFAAGFSCAQEKIHLLEDTLLAGISGMKQDEKSENVFVDAELSLDQVSWTTYREVEKLAPFGCGNPKPLFIFKNVPIKNVKVFGKQKNHLELGFEGSDGKQIKSIGFFMTTETWGSELVPGEKIDLVATFEKSHFRNFPELRLRIVDVVRTK
jgi:single-stranded-DNA-specific exonuclease